MVATGNETALPGGDQTDLATVERIVRAAGTSFYQGMRVLPADRRHAMYAIYAFCRVVDDIADEDGTLEDKRRELAIWRDHVRGMYRGEPRGMYRGEPRGMYRGEPRGLHPGESEAAIIRVLAAAVTRFGLRAEDFLAVIDGMEMDAETTIVAPGLATLDLYCDRVAAAVGRLSVRAFGDSSPAADRVAHALGRALQLTNILRDIQEDAERHRLYLPAEFLDEAGVPHDPAAALTSPGLPRVCARVAALAHRHFDTAWTEMRLCDRRAMRPARLMAATYGALLRELERSGWRDPAARVSLPKWRKLWLACRYGLF
jgi:presqualene diphosphate synthase